MKEKRFMISDNPPIVCNDVHCDNVREWAEEDDVSLTAMHVAYCQETQQILN